MVTTWVHKLHSSLFQDQITFLTHSHFDLLLTDKKWNIAWYLGAEEQSFYYMQCFSSSRRSDFSRKCYTALQFRQTGSIWCFVNLKIRNERLFLFQGERQIKGLRERCSGIDKYQKLCHQYGWPRYLIIKDQTNI